MNVEIEMVLGACELHRFNRNYLQYKQLSDRQILTISVRSTTSLQLTERKQERLNTPTSQQNTWTPVPDFIEIHVVLCKVSVMWNNRWGIGIPELQVHAERHSAFNTGSKWILLVFDFYIFWYFSHKCDVCKYIDIKH